MNYGEESIYWYLRLNGFFPISNFVIHRSDNIDYPSDCDILAIRTPFVYESIGGNLEDWDQQLFNLLQPNCISGIICEVKTGGYEVANIFRDKYMKYIIGRLGFIPQENIDELHNNLKNTPSITFESFGVNYQIIKVLFSNNPQNSENFSNISLASVTDFLRNRVRRYPKEKYGQRMFFSSVLFQHIISDTVLGEDLL